MMNKVSYHKNKTMGIQKEDTYQIVNKANL